MSNETKQSINLTYATALTDTLTRILFNHRYSRLDQYPTVYCCE